MKYFGKTLKPEYAKEIQGYIHRAAAEGFELTPESFRITAAEGVTVDGMDFAEWLDAMTMD